MAKEEGGMEGTNEGSWSLEKGYKLLKKLSCHDSELCDSDEASMRGKWSHVRLGNLGGKPSGDDGY